MELIDFNQAAFIKEVFAFMRRNKLSIRKFALLAGCSPATFYQARGPKAIELRPSTMRRMQKAMEDYLKEVL